MGRWGLGPYENDAGADFADEFTEAASERIEMLNKATSEIVGYQGTIDATRAEEAFAAAAIVASGLPNGDEFRLPDVDTWNGGEPAPDVLIGLAYAAVSRLIEGDNLLAEDWADQGKLETHNAMLQRLQLVLAGRNAGRQLELW
jgi:hypothetical protein